MTMNIHNSKYQTSITAVNHLPLASASQLSLSEEKTKRRRAYLKLTKKNSSFPPSTTIFGTVSKLSKVHCSDER